MNDLERRLVDITYRNGLSHLSSTLSSINIIDEIYSTKHRDDPFILSNGHAALAWYCVLEKYHGHDAEALLQQHGIHPHRDPAHHITVSTGSLGMGITVAVGYALACPDRTVYCLISDGESGEGSVWEALRFIHERGITNIRVYANVNGQIAYDSIDVDYICRRYRAFLPDIEIRLSEPPRWPWAQGVLTHYYVLRPQDYEALCANDLAS